MIRVLPENDFGLHMPGERRLVASVHDPLEVTRGLVRSLLLREPEPKS